MSAVAGRGRAPRKVVVVGLGNPDRGDDGVGAAIAGRLAGRLPDDVVVVTDRGDLLSRIEEWAACDALVCIDAAAPVGVPGRMHRLDLATDELPRGSSPTSSHGFGVADVIALARALGSAPRDIVVYAVEGAAFDAGAPMTRAVAAAVNDAVDRVVAEVAQLRRPRA